MERAKWVLVVGGGTTGCEAAIAAAKKGHKVTLMEQSDRLAGQGDLLKAYFIQVLLNTRADAELIGLYAPDVLILATGAESDGSLSDAVEKLTCSVVIAGHESE